MPDVLYHDPFTGLTHVFEQADDKTFKLGVRGSDAYTDAILDANKHDANHASNWSASRDLKHVARIPPSVYVYWLHAYGVDALDPDHKEAVKKLLNDRDWLFLRTGGGQL
jgi:hypothetical protein